VAAEITTAAVAMPSTSAASGDVGGRPSVRVVPPRMHDDAGRDGRLGDHAVDLAMAVVEELSGDERGGRSRRWSGRA
jgi:hypothetical protein